MNSSPTLPAVSSETSSALERLFEVVLHNDDVNSMEYVVECLMRVFGHSAEVAVRVMLEAHHRGQAVAEVEAESLARRHRDQLQSLRLIATIHPL